MLNKLIFLNGLLLQKIINIENNIKYNTENHAIKILFLFTIWCISPIFSIGFLFIFFAKYKLNRTNKFIVLLLISSALGLINASKQPISDLLNYYNWYIEFNAIDITDYFKIRPIDPVFYLPTAIASHIFNGYPPTFSFFWTVFTYLLLSYSIIGIGAANSLGQKSTVGLLFFGIAVGYSFPLSGHLVRQYASMSLLIFSISLLLQDNKKYSYIFIFSALTHFSSLIFAPAFFISKKEFFNKNNQIAIILILSIIFYIIGSYNLLEIINSMGLNGGTFINNMAERSSLYSEIEGSNINAALFFLYVIFFIFFIFTYAVKNGNDKIGFKILIFLSFYFLVLIITRNSGLLFDRYFFYGPVILIILMAYLFSKYIYTEILYIPLLVISSIIYFFRILSGSEFNYINNSYNIITFSIFDFIFYIKDNFY
ncbi:EpsG family protein [Polynucleobacter sp. Latsch14-2]|uniref:EpsG family protein n=1 Tax=Polynucleobacter sp. Latsch14-2 TaxID=2576920 RepID=UPI001C0B6E25|nr:EpsG family protein [Polynucleobacter sp. Latsch14-2]MBU3615523.1 EpsG family protein [Polynucleobacter sp. Latsch14-2]